MLFAFYRKCDEIYFPHFFCLACFLAEYIILRYFTSLGQNPIHAAGAQFDVRSPRGTSGSRPKASRRAELFFAFHTIMLSFDI